MCYIIQTNDDRRTSAAKRMSTTEHPRGEVADSNFVISRVLKAPRQRVFKAWTDPKLLAQWWGPHTFINPVCQAEARAGGPYRIVMRSPEGVDYPLKGVFREVAEPERLVLTMDCSEHPAGWQALVNPDRKQEENNPAGEMLATIRFEASGANTRLTIRIRFESATICDAMLRMGMSEGWSESLERLRDLVAAPAPIVEEQAHGGLAG